MTYEPWRIAGRPQQIESGHDIYLLKHMECFKDMTPLMEYPVLEPDLPAVFELSDPAQAHRVFQSGPGTPKPSSASWAGLS